METHSHATCAPPSCATESSPYPTKIRSYSFAARSPSVPSQRPPSGAAYEPDEGRRAAELYERIFLGYGDDSVAQLGGAHVACEWVSNVMTKMLQRPDRKSVV